MQLLTDPTSNPKVAKNAKGEIGVLTAPLHLAPARLSGFNVCPKASKGCIAACLHTAGNPLYMPGKERARIARTKWYFEDRPAFMLQLHKEIAALARRAKKAGMLAGVRLNATSDIPWHRVAYTGPDGTRHRNVMSAFPDVSFYDYTKRPPKASDVFPANYHLTFSLAENNDRDAITALCNGMNVAAVFAVKRGQPLPPLMGVDTKGKLVATDEAGPFGSTVRVIDGDLHDYRPADGKHPLGVIVGLRAKGKAIHDASGFVRPAS